MSRAVFASPRRVPAPVVLLLLWALLSAGAGGEPPESPRAAGRSNALPDGALIRLVSPRSGRSGRIRSAVFGPDEQQIITVYEDGTAGVWDVATSKELRRVGENGPELYAAALTPDGKRLATVTDRGAPRLWDTATGKELTTLRGEKHLAVSLAFSPDGKWLLAGCGDGHLQVWETAAGPPVLKLRGEYPDWGPWLDGIAVSPDGKTVASGGLEGTVRLWELRTGRVLHTLGQRDWPVVLNLTFSPDGKLLAWMWGRDVWVADPVAGKVLWQLPPHEAAISALGFSPDRRVLAVADTTHAVHLRDVLTGKKLRTFAGHEAEVTGLAFAADGRTLLSASADRTVLLWDVPGYKTITPPGDLDLTDLLQLFNGLQSADALRAYRAMAVLAAVPKESVPFLNQRLRLATPVDGRRVARWVADLDSPEFPVQEKAAAALEELGPAGVPALRKALAGDLKIPVRQRLDQVLESVLLRGVQDRREAISRTLEVLERSGTPQAREVLSKVVEAEIEPWLTEEAKGCLQRLSGNADWFHEPAWGSLS
jgi:WD40 repeat protein